MIGCQFVCFCVVPNLNARYTKVNHVQLVLVACNGGEGRNLKIDRLFYFLLITAVLVVLIRPS